MKDKATRFLYDVAHGCFLLYSLTVLFLVLLAESEARLYLFIYLWSVVALVLVSFIAGLVGLVLSIRLWKYPPLMLLVGSRDVCTLVCMVVSAPEKATFSQAMKLDGSVLQIRTLPSG